MKIGIPTFILHNSSSTLTPPALVLHFLSDESTLAIWLSYSEIRILPIIAKDVRRRAKRGRRRIAYHTKGKEKTKVAGLAIA